MSFLQSLYRPLDSHPPLFTQQAYLPNASGAQAMQMQLNQAATSQPPTHVMHHLLALSPKDFTRLSSLSLSSRAKIYVGGAAEARGIAAEALPPETIVKVAKLKRDIDAVNAQLRSLRESREALQASMSSHPQTNAQHAKTLKDLQEQMASIRLKQKSFQTTKEQLEKERKECKRAFADTKQAGK